MKKEMLINCLQSEEIRIAILENGVLEELYVERASAESYVGNIYKGRVVNIEPSIQAAFIDFGVGRNGFLHVSDVEPAYYREGEDRDDRGPQRGGRGGRDDRGGRGGHDDRGGRGRGGRDDRGGRGRDDRGPRRYEETSAPRQPATDAGGYPPDLSSQQAPVDFEGHEGPEIIVEQIVEDDGDYHIEPAPAEMHEPTDAMEGDWPVEGELVVDDMLPPDFDEAPSATLAISAPVRFAEPVPDPRVDSVIDSIVIPSEPTPAASENPPTGEAEKDEADEGKAKRRSLRGAKAKPRARKPRKRAGDETAGESTDGGAPPESPPTDAAPTSDEPRPRPMESTERRTDGDEHGHVPLEPRPAASARDILDEELSFSIPPPRPTTPAPAYTPPAPRPPAPMSTSTAAPTPVDADFDRVEFDEPPESSGPVNEDNIVETFDDEDDPLNEPLLPPIAKFDPTDSYEDLAEEEKTLEDVEADQRDDPTASPVGFDDERQADFEDEFSNTEAFAPRSRGRSGDRGGRGGDRGGRGGDRGGRGGDRGGRGGDRGGRGGDRGAPRGGRDRDRGPKFEAFGRPKPNIEDIFKRGQEVLVQVIKEGIGTKGPTLSTYISIAGRYLVLMPGLNRIGVSRKIEDIDTRRRLREIMNELRPPKGIGFIIRTAGQDRDANELQGDLAYLSRLWEVVVRRISKQKSPTEVYRESDMVTRTIRDIFAGDIDTIWVDERGAYEAAKEFMEAVMPKFADRIKFYDSAEPMFNKYGVESEIARIQQRKVPLPHGGSIVIDQTEALVAIDVNSGNFRADNNNAEETAYQMNMHAAKEIARQLRLRDLGGVIANDFIDMRDERHRRNVEKALRDAVERDRARTKILRMSQFGVIEMTRQRIRPSLNRSAFQDCAHCKGRGHVKTCESVSIEVMRLLQSAVNRVHVSRIDIRVHEEAAQYLLNRKRKQIVALEDVGSKQVSIISAGHAVSPEFMEFLCFDNNGNEVKFAVVEEPPQRPQRRRY